MCGIFGMVSDRSRGHRSYVDRALELLAHRGPDGKGLWCSPGAEPPFVNLGHRRLAIIDLSEGAAQPMSNDDGTRWLTYNGEVYNYLELMAELEAKGHSFRTRSDTEVVLRAYEEWGTSCLDRFNGMFAFALWDGKKRELFAARDRFGEKPFHYVWDPRRGFFAFASEIKALLALPEVEGALDDRALYRFIAFNELSAAEQTLWAGVKRLPHAHWLKLAWQGDGFSLSVRRYWDIDLERTETLGLGEAAARLRELFADSVRLRLRSDVAVGTSLSGGLDSSAVVCQIHALGAAGGQKTFSARMEDPALDEGAHIARVRAQTGIEGYEVWPRAEELRSIFPKLCYHLEEPFLSTSQFAQHLVMRLAREHAVTVLLDGQGADELLAGYRPYFLTLYVQLAAEGQILALWRELRGFRSRHSRAFPLSLRALIARLAPGLHGLVKRVRSRTTPPPGSLRKEMADWWNREWLQEFAAEKPSEPPAYPRDRLTRRLYYDALQGVLQELLRYGDRNSMAWSRELRQPFLDHRLAEFLFALPASHKLHGGQAKVVLREAIKGLVPEATRQRQDKLGFQAPVAAWLAGPLSDWTAERLEQVRAEFPGRFAPDGPDRFRGRREPLDDAVARTVFSLLTLGETRRQLRALGHGS